MLRRLDKAFAAFFRRVKQGETPGFPRFKGRNRFKSLEFTYGDGKGFAPSHPFPTEALAKRIRLGWSRGAANVLLATAPDHTGRMRPEDVEQLRQLGRLLREKQ